MKEKRIHSVDNYIQSMGIVSMEDLCSHFGISMSTLRRDINQLLAQKRVQKVYGGVAAINQTVVPFKKRDVICKTEKSAIAKRAASLIAADELIFIDSGTTTDEILQYLPEYVTRLTVLTNNLDIINYIANNCPDINVIVLGCLYNHSTQSFVGTDNLHILEKYNISKAFIAATAVSIENGLTNSDIQEFEIKRQVVAKAKSVYLLADASKFDRATLLTYAKLSDIDGVITSPSLPKSYEDYFKQHNIELFYETV